jgi:predicted ATPase
MITKWTVANFKSIVKETSLPLAPLTIFAGPNSSGKSTVLQSLLLVCQTLSHKVGSRSVVLNGTLTRLGQFDDLRSYEGEFDQITIGWECHPTGDAQMAIIENMRFPGPMVIYGRRMDSIKAITCKLSFDTNPGSPERDLFQLQPQLFLFTMSLLARAEDNTDRRYELTVTRSKDGRAKIANLKVEEPDNEISRASLEYDIVLDQDSLEELREELITAEPVGCILRHFLPERLSIRVNKIEEIARQIQMVLMDDTPRYRRAPFMDRELVIPGALIAQLQAKLGEKYSAMFAKQTELFEVGAAMPVREWMDRTRRLSPDKRRDLRRSLSEWTDLQGIIVKILRSENKANDSEYQLLPYRPPIDLMNASAYLNLFFSNSVKYLGPLRDEPKPLYPLAAHADPTDIGLRGEMTAAVLNLHRERLIRYIPSVAFSKTPFEPGPVPRSLEAAVTDWLKYLGVAETAHSVDKGKLGHELKVSLSEGGPDHDLTHVGVGVSQVLPILLMSLLADRDTTLIFEQPELHLHPKVQTRLADFFLSIVLLGKQCLIETHSEYLINRLRYRAAAEETTNRVTENLKVYFVEKIDGSSNFREIKVNEYGAILDWPEGFFDQSQLESESILRAASAKRKKQRGK